jgi:late competence protein required for DNA uptake (superfamily II DNA/RNA helicase)
MLNFFKTSTNTERFTSLFSHNNTADKPQVAPVATAKTTKSEQINFRTDKATRVILEKEAASRGLTVSALIHSVLSANLKA